MQCAFLSVPYITMPTKLSSWLSAVAVAICTVVGFVLFSNTRVHILSSGVSSTNTTVVSVSVSTYINSTQLAQACLVACGAGGSCSQNPLSGITDCLQCGGGAAFTIDPSTGACVNTADCANWAWCTAQEAVTVTANHTSLVLHSWFGPGPMNFTYPFPVDRYSELAPFVPTFADSTTAVAALLDMYVSGQLALGGGGAYTVEYFTDQGSYWSLVASGGLQLYKAAVPGLYVNYIKVLKSKVCARTWLATNGTCIVPGV